MVEGTTEVVELIFLGAIAASEAAKAQADVEQRKLDLEEKRLRDEKEAKEAVERKEKGAKYREDGKPLTAFLVEVNPLFISWSNGLRFFIFD